MRTQFGGCHCGQVRFETVVDTTSAISCNCSFCTKHGGLLAIVPADHFRLKSDEAVLREYQFGEKGIHHHFCGSCGIGSFLRGAMPDGSPMVAVNLRCVDGIDLSVITITPHEGLHA
ncbi:GFA family protein [Roseomonas xinghualingensis]|uniref:GFA family protein n=1 Tax=Roseomonas xinghualingensis TaxID=2986475 RepID=UPI0021F0DB73|nr:GFA family protein [Roseomonas sp. SXEYE001]MCV4210384.1 GFA family protein [Roseomonas sp. SXEYE001]